MVHQAARRQIEAATTCTQLLSRTGKDITVGLTTALSLLTPVTFTCPRIDPELVHTVVSHQKHRYHLKESTCHVWPNVGTTGAVIDVHGIQCLSPEAVFAQMSTYLDLPQLVQCLDSLTCRNEKLKRTTLDRTANFVESCGPLRGREQCMRALRLAREDTDSPMETQLRLALACWGLPEMSVNFPLMTVAGLRMLDLALPDYRIGIEFDGQHHRLQREQDQERLHDIQSELWTVFVVTNDMMVNHILFDRFLRSLTLTLQRSGMPEFDLRDEPMTVRELSDARSRRMRYTTRGYKN